MVEGGQGIDRMERFLNSLLEGTPNYAELLIQA